MQISLEEFDGRLNPDLLNTRISISSDSAANTGAPPMSAYEDD